jgi:hypothetical protein
LNVGNRNASLITIQCRGFSGCTGVLRTTSIEEYGCETMRDRAFGHTMRKRVNGTVL